jgi:TolB-like protein
MFIPHEQSDNTFLASAILPPDLRRVAVLPLAWEGSQIDLAQGAETLVPILLTELDKTKKFEVVSISREDLRSQTGRLSWTGAEILPTDFFDSLQRVYGCDAVLFSQLTTFRAYAPMVVGWRMKLVEAQTGKILWAVDKVFDAGQQPAVNQTPRPLAALWPFHDDTDDWRAENSPRQFGQFTIAQALSTLPNRKEMAKVSAPATDVPSGRQSDKKLSPLKKNYGN